MSHAARTNLLLPAGSLCQRELVRFVRQPNRVVGALATPIVFWLLIGAGMGKSFRADASPGTGTGPGGYIEYFFPGTILMVLLFTAIFSTISIIEDRREGFLQSVLVAPVPRMAIVLGKVLGGTVLATAQGIVFLLLAPLIGIHLGIVSSILSIAMMLVMSFALTALGLCIAWRMSSTQGFHAIMNLFLMPMWFLSGALFPASGAWAGLRWVMRLNPLSYGLAGLRQALYWHHAPAVAGALPGLALSMLVSIAFALVMFLLAAQIAAGSVRADLH
jgi:ABC-2 type transport system permease protein